MGVIHIVSQQPGAGKTTLAAALLLKLVQAQTPGAYYNPVSPAGVPGEAPGAAFIQDTLLAPNDCPAIPPPSPLPTDTSASSGLPEDLAQHVKSTVESLRRSATGVILDGPDLEPATGLSPTAAAQLTALASAKAVVLFRHPIAITGAEIARRLEPFGPNLGGIILTCVAKHRIDEAKNGILAELRSLGLPVAGLIPESRILHGPTVRQLAETLGARWVQEPVNTDAPVEQFLIGGNIMDSGPEYYGRYAHQAVITRCQRPDIQLASLLAGTKCLVLTGGGEPTEYIKTEAMQRDVPLMVVSSNTLDTAEALAPLADLAHSYNLIKITEFSRQLDRHLDVEALLAFLA